MPDTITSLALIPFVAVTAAWIAWRLRIPSILALLGAGLVVGPLLGWLEPDAVLGDLVQPLVVLSVALILFEGGLSLTRGELRRGGRVTALLLTVGVGITFGVGFALATTVLQLDPGVSAVLAAVLVVTGPTVVGPLLASIRPRGDVGAVLKAEGILVDPLGAVLAALVFQAAFGPQVGPALLEVSRGILVFAVVGLAVGAAGAVLAVVALRRYLVPDQLVTAFGVALALGAFALANSIYEESGLLATTVMGMLIGTQRRGEVRALLEFNESLRTLLIAGLFVVLGARLTTDQIGSIRWATLLFVLGLVLVARPLAVAICTFGSSLSWQQRVFAAWMAPRGIVAAAVSAVFALRLQDAGEAGGQELVPTVFLTILLTIAIYGLTGPPVARRLGLADTNAQGLLVLGAGPLSVAIGTAVRDAGFRVLLADTDADAIAEARRAGLEVYPGTVLSDRALTDLDLRSLGQMLAVTTNREAAALTAQHFGRTFGRRHVFMVPISPREESGERELSSTLRARRVQTGGRGVVEMTAALTQGARVETVLVGTETRPSVKAGRVPLAVVKRDHTLHLVGEDLPVSAEKGDHVIEFVEPAAT